MEQGLITIIIYLVGNFFRIYIINLFLRAFFVTDATAKWKTIRYLCYGLYYISNSMGFLYFHWSSAVILATNLISIFIISLTYKGKWKYKICASVAVMALAVVCEDWAYNMSLLFEVEHVLEIGTAASDLIFLLIVLIIQKVVEFRKGEDVDFFEWLAVIGIPVVSIFISVNTFDKCENQSAVTIGAIGLLVVNFFVFYLLDRIIKMRRKEFDLELLSQQNKAYGNQMEILLTAEEKISSFRHDIKNHILALEQLSKEDDSKKVQTYLSNLNPLIEQQNRFVSTGNLVLDSLANIKIAVASKDLGAKIKTEINVSKNIRVDDVDMSIIIGNLLDNAIEALQKCSGDKYLNLSIEERQGVLFIKVVNSFDGKLKKSGNLFETTKVKKEGHGIGLKNVKRVLEKYKGEINVDAHENNFKVEIVLYYN